MADNNDDEIDTTTKRIETDVGEVLTITSKRGSGTYDNDKIKKEISREESVTDEEEQQAIAEIKQTMRALRKLQPDEDDSALEQALAKVRDGEMTVEEALDALE